MKILIAHNRYQQPGGEDAVVKTEFNLLKDFGEEVRLYERTNDEINDYSLVRKIDFLWNMGWSTNSYDDIRRVLKEFSPEVVHFHNIFFTITPSVYQACRDEGVPVVQSLHNFRPLCSNGLFFRGGETCEKCMKKNFWYGVYYGCFKNSRVATVFIARMLARHWRAGTWTNMIDVFMTATKFTKDKYVQGGIPAEKIMIKPNFLYPFPEPEISPDRKKNGYALYVGRLSEEKGVDVLLSAWKFLTGIPLRVLGDGPLLEKLRKYAQENHISNIEFLGYVSSQEYEINMKGAKVLIVPSRCYENFPRIIAEAYAYGLPVVASQLGSLAEIVEDGRTGYLFTPGDTNDLALKVGKIMSDEDGLSRMSAAARRVFEEKYGPQRNYQSLMAIYQKAINVSRKVARVFEKDDA